MLNLTKSDFPNFEDYERNLSEDKTVYFDKVKLSHKIGYDRTMRDTLEDLVRGHVMFKSGGTIFDIGRAEIEKYLTQIEKVPYQKLLKFDKYSKTRKVSLAAEIMEKIQRDGHAPEFLDLYMAYNHYKTAVSRISKTYERMAEAGVVGNNGYPLMKLGYALERRITGRYYTSSIDDRTDNIQGIGKQYLSCMTVPEGYFLGWGDFAQIDLRSAFNIYLRGDEQADKYFFEIEDKYEAFARAMTHTLGIEFDEEKFADERQKFKTSILSRVYGASIETMLNKTPDLEFVKSLDTYFRKNKRYTEYYEALKEIIDFGVDLEVEDYFGHVMEIPISRKNDESLEQGLNYPVQSTSNSIVMHLVNKTVQKFRDMGYGPDKFKVYQVRHDEPIYMIHEDCLRDLWILHDYSHIQVDDWSPLTCEFAFGKYYGEEDPDLMEYFNMVKNNCEPLLTPQVKVEHQVYNPVKKAFSAAIVKETVEDHTIVGVWFDSKREGYFEIVPEGQNAFDLGLKRLTDYAEQNNGRYVKVTSDGINELKMVGDLYVEISDADYAARGRAQLFTIWRMHDYLNSIGKHDLASELVKKESDFGRDAKVVQLI